MRLREQHGHDALHVAEAGLRATGDAIIAAVARAEGRAMVTENVAHFAVERDLVLVVVPKRKLSAGGGQAAGLAGLLDRWAKDNPDLYTGPPLADVTDSADNLLEVVEVITVPQRSGGSVLEAFGSLWATAVDDTVLDRVRP